MSAGADAKAELSREIRDFYNSELDAAKATMPRVRGNITGQRQKFFLARLRENGMESVKEVIRKAAQSDFLNGGGKTGFVANFEWLMRPANFPKVLDGNYDNREPAKKTTSKNDNGGNSNGSNGYEQLTPKQKFIREFEEKQREEYQRMGVDITKIQQTADGTDVF